MGRILGKNFFKRVVLCGNKTPKSQFRASFEKEISLFVDNIYIAYKAFRIIEKECNGDIRKVWTVAYIYNAIQNLISAFNIFISGFIVPSGNLMRHFHESVAMAMLLSNDSLQYFNDYIKDPRGFKVYKVFSYIEKHLSSFSINHTSWKNFIKIKDFYHNFSHSSVLSIASLSLFESDKKLLVLGSNYDAGKVKQYKMEIDRMVNAAGFLKNVIDGVGDQLKIAQ